MHVPGANHYAAHGLWHHNSGKSWIGAYDLIRRAKPNRLYMVVAPTYIMLADSSLRSFLMHAENLGVLAKPFNRSAFNATLRNGAEVLFRSADNPDRLRGPNLTGIWMDEASLQPEEVYNILVGRLRQAGEVGWLSATFTPKGKVNWTYRVFGMGAPDTAIIHATTEDNPFLPERFEGTVRKQYTSTLARQELGGEFMDAVGALFKREWFKNFVDADKVPIGVRRVRFWDKAATQDAGDWTVGLLMGCDDVTGLFYVTDVVRGRWSPHTRNEIIEATAKRDGISVEVLTEQEGGSGGKESAQYTLRQLQGFNVHAEPATGKKHVRAEPFAAQCEAGNIVIVRGLWNAEFLDELVSFQFDEKMNEHDDQVDAASGAFNRLALKNTWGGFGGSNPREAEFARIPGGDPTLGRLERGWGGDGFGGGE